jgi:peroxiredoxin
MMQSDRDESRIQAEIASGPVAASGELPRKGQCLRDFRLKTAEGHAVSLSDYRARASLVLILSDGRGEAGKLIAHAAAQYREIAAKDADVLAILPGGHPTPEQEPLHLPFPVLLDENDRIHRELGALDEAGHCAAAVYILDRFGEVFASYRTAAGEPLPSVSEIRDKLEFITFQCPECEAPEWPV